MKNRWKYVVPIPLNSMRDVFKMIRSQFVMWHYRKEVKEAGKLGRGKYPCTLCGAVFGPKKINIDHIEPVGETPECVLRPRKLEKVDYEEIGRWIYRVFANKNNLQRICIECHKEKTAREATERSL